MKITRGSNCRLLSRQVKQSEFPAAPASDSQICKTIIPQPRNTWGRRGLQPFEYASTRPADSPLIRKPCSLPAAQGWTTAPCGSREQDPDITGRQPKTAG